MPRVRRPIVTFPCIENARVPIPKFLEPSPEFQELIELFQENRILNVLSIRDPFSSRFVRDFYNSLEVVDGSSVLATINHHRVTINHEILARSLEISNAGVNIWTINHYRDYFDWSQVNLLIHGVEQAEHLLDVSTLTPLANQVQKVLRSTIFQKSGDSIHLNSTLSYVTYLIISRTPFDLSQAFLDQMIQVNRMKAAGYNRNHALVLGHILHEYFESTHHEVSLERYNIDCIPIHFRPQDIGVFQRAGRRRVREEAREEPAAEPTLQSLESRLDRLSINVGAIQHDIGDIYRTMEDTQNEQRRSRRRETRMLQQLDYLVQHTGAPPREFRRLHRRDIDEEAGDEDSD